MAVLVAQSPQAWTPDMSVEPCAKFSSEVTNPAANSPHSDALTQLTGMIEYVESDLEDRCCQ